MLLVELILIIKNKNMIFFFFGFLGGVLRGTMGVIKYTQSYKDVEIRPIYFSGTVIFSGFIGMICAWIISDMGIAIMGIEELPLSFALIAGYAGGDFIENIFKIVIKKTDIFSFSKVVK